MWEACAMARFCDSNQKRGVTLVELIVVLVILAVLAALLVPSLTGYIDKAVEKRVMLQARSLMTAAQATAPRLGRARRARLSKLSVLA